MKPWKNKKIKYYLSLANVNKCLKTKAKEKFSTA